jgi:hypothetical protein
MSIPVPTHNLQSCVEIDAAYTMRYTERVDINSETSWETREASTGDWCPHSRAPNDSLLSRSLIIINDSIPTPLRHAPNKNLSSENPQSISRGKNTCPGNICLAAILPRMVDQTTLFIKCMNTSTSAYSIVLHLHNDLPYQIVASFPLSVQSFAIYSWSQLDPLGCPQLLLEIQKTCDKSFWSQT